MKKEHLDVDTIVFDCIFFLYFWLWVLLCFILSFFIQHNENVPKFLETTTETQHFPVTAHFFLFLFTVLVSIILMNLLVGLAVSDIQGLSKSARLHQLIQQVPGVQYILSRRKLI